MKDLKTHTYLLEVTVVYCDNGPIFKVDFSNTGHDGPYSVRYTDSIFSVSKQLEDALLQEIFSV